MVLSKKNQGKWYERYFPFVARSPKMQIKWLVSTFNKKVLTEQEITPYIRILLMGDDNERMENLKDLLNALDESLLEKFLSAADIYDVPRLFEMIDAPTVKHAVVALKKSPPPYEKRPLLILDKIFHAIHNASESLVEQGAETLRQRGEAPDHFEEAYQRFQEIVEDEQILSALFPKAKS